MSWLIWVIPTRVLVVLVGGRKLARGALAWLLLLVVLAAACAHQQVQTRIVCRLYRDCDPKDAGADPAESPAVCIARLECHDVEVTR